MTDKTGQDGQATQQAAQPSEAQRLPCRGCLPDCSNRNRCNGKPWRMRQPSQDTSTP